MKLRVAGVPQIQIEWGQLSQMTNRKYQCGFCGSIVASSIGASGVVRQHAKTVHVYICPNCTQPTFFGLNGIQLPDVAPGSVVEGVPEDVAALYNEARECIGASCYTASVLASRKLLMNIAVSQGADEGKRFVEYVSYLAERGYVPPNGGPWVDHIRQKGNEATHEIAPMHREDAKELVVFSEMLLKFIYEFPSKVPGADNGGGNQGAT